MPDVMIQVENLTKDYGPTRAVDKVTFNVHKGEVLGFLGPNGAGKSTTMKMLTCFLAPPPGGPGWPGSTSTNSRWRSARRSATCPRTRPSTAT